MLEVGNAQHFVLKSMLRCLSSVCSCNQGTRLLSGRYGTKKSMSYRRTAGYDAVRSASRLTAVSMHFAYHCSLHEEVAAIITVRRSDVAEAHSRPSQAYLQGGVGARSRRLCPGAAREDA